MTNKDLEIYINKLKSGDKSAFSPIYQETYKSVYYMCYSVVKNAANAEDLTQDTFVRMYERILSYQEGTNFKAWLLQIAKNLSMNFSKRNSRIESLDPQAEEFRLEDEDSNNPQDQIDVFGAAKRVLSEEEFQIVMYIVVDGLKRREVSAMLDMPIGTVTWKYNIAMKKLKDELERHE